MSVEYVIYEGHRFIIGPGLDDVIDGLRRIVLLDEYYGNIYGDYIFLGYDTFYVAVDHARSDLVNLYNAVYILREGHSVVVCGDDPRPCLYTLAAYISYTKLAEPSKALEESRRLLKPLYGEKLEKIKVSRACMAAINALHKAVRMLGEKRLALLMSLASNYGWGWGELHYSEHVSWTSRITEDDATLLASMLHFLAEGPGSEKELLEIRLEAIGRDNLRDAVGGPIDDALRILEEYARGSTRGEAGVLRLIEKLEPGKGGIFLVEREQDNLIVYCVGEGGIPARACIEKVGGIESLAKELGFKDVRVRIADWV